MVKQMKFEHFKWKISMLLTDRADTKIHYLYSYLIALAWRNIYAMWEMSAAANSQIFRYVKQQKNQWWLATLSIFVLHIQTFRSNKIMCTLNIANIQVLQSILPFCFICTALLYCFLFISYFVFPSGFDSILLYFMLSFIRSINFYLHRICIAVLAYKFTFEINAQCFHIMYNVAVYIVLQFMLS